MAEVKRPGTRTLGAVLRSKFSSNRPPLERGFESLVRRTAALALDMLRADGLPSASRHELLPLAAMLEDLSTTARLDQAALEELSETLRGLSTVPPPPVGQDIDFWRVWHTLVELEATFGLLLRTDREIASAFHDLVDTILSGELSDAED